MEIRFGRGVKDYELLKTPPRCAFCREDLVLDDQFNRRRSTVDHFWPKNPDTKDKESIPVFLRGKQINSRINYIVICGECNGEKANELPSVYLSKKFAQGRDIFENIVLYLNEFLVKNEKNWKDYVSGFLPALNAATIDNIFEKTEKGVYINKNIGKVFHTVV